MTTPNPTDTQLQGETLEPPERIWISPASFGYKTKPSPAYIYDETSQEPHDIEYVRAAVAGPRGDAIKELFDLLSQNKRGEWCFNSLSRDWLKFQDVMKRLAADAHQVRCVHGVPEGLTCAICGPIRNDDPPALAPAESTRVAAEDRFQAAAQDVVYSQEFMNVPTVVEILKRHFVAAAPADNDAEKS